MDIATRLALIKRNTVEIVTEEDLRRAIETGRRLRGYIGFEPSGIFHIGWLVWAFKFKDLVEADIDMILFAATWHAWINDKLGGDRELINAAARHVVRVLELLGIDMSRVRVVYADELVSDEDYWSTLLRIAKNLSLSRVKRALTIMGRREDEAELDFSKLIYPLMQVTDIFKLGVDIALGGIDQRKAHMLARDVAEKLGWQKPIAIHTPLIPSLRGVGRMDVRGEVDEVMSQIKMSKSRPESAIFVLDSDEEIRRKIRAAYCPPRQVENNPIMAIAKYIVFARPKARLYIDRKPEYGGPVEFYSYEELEKAFIEGKLHPLDLKNAIADELIKIIKPIREALLSDPKTRSELELIMHHVSR